MNEQEDLDDSQEVEIGEVQFFLIQLGLARQAGSTAFETLDSLGETAEYLALLTEHGEWTEDVQKRFEVYSDDILVLNRITIKPEFRGRGFALLTLRVIIKTFSELCGLIACKPFPLQHEGSKQVQNRIKKPVQDPQFLKDQAHLRRYWQRLGFKRVPKTELLAMSPALKMPSLRSVVRGIDMNRAISSKAARDFSPGANKQSRSTE